MKPRSDTPHPRILQMTPSRSARSFHTARNDQEQGEGEAAWSGQGGAEKPRTAVSPWAACLAGPTRLAAWSRGNWEDEAGDPLADWCWLEAGLARRQRLHHFERLLWTTSVFSSNWGRVSANPRTSPANCEEVRICCLLTGFWFFF